MGTCELENLPDLIAGFRKISGYCSNMHFIMKNRYDLFFEDEKALFCLVILNPNCLSARIFFQFKKLLTQLLVTSSDILENEFSQ